MPKWPRKGGAIQANSLPHICNTRPEKGPHNILKLELRSKSHRYTALGKRHN